jgi:hypothetical protein
VLFLDLSTLIYITYLGEKTRQETVKDL